MVQVDESILNALTIYFLEKARQEQLIEGDEKNDGIDGKRDMEKISQ